MHAYAYMQYALVVARLATAIVLTKEDLNQIKCQLIVVLKMKFCRARIMTMAWLKICKRKVRHLSSITRYKGTPVLFFGSFST